MKPSELTDLEYLYELANMYGNIPSPEMLEHSKRLTAIRSRYETLERQMAYHFSKTSFSKQYSHKYVLAEPSRKQTLQHHHHSPTPIPHILG